MTPRVANRRIRLLGVMLALVLGAALARAAWIQGVRAGTLGRMADAQHQETATVPPTRGSIFDRTGVELARDEPATTVYANPKEIRQPAAVAAKAATALGLNRTQLADLIGRLGDRTTSFAYVEREADATRAERLMRMKLPGVYSYPEDRRVYPQGAIAAQLLGWVGTDHTGLAGMELQEEWALHGTAGHEVVVKTPEGKVIQVLSSRPVRQGGDVVLSIDHAIQLEVEQVLNQTIKRYRARSGSAVVLDPATGDVLALAGEPGYNANIFDLVPTALQRERPVTDAYEPGSTFKLVTVAGSLQDGLVTPSTTFKLPYQIQVADRLIHDAEPRPTERLSVAQILSRSSNVGAITLSRKLGKQRLSSWISRFGFGRTTGIGFPGESAGYIPTPDHWYGSTAGTVPIGQGLTVTPVQLAAAYASIANHGVWVRPRLVLRTGDRRAAASERRRIVSAGVASELMTMLRDVVDEGTGTQAGIPGYTVAGKTGTAAEVDPRTGRYSTSKYDASFVGMVPASNPRLVILVSVYQPDVIWGGTVAAPAFQQIALFCLRYLEVPPDGKQ
ncbi:MAG: peptidoglycan D,D-transpeptidase FtsI family protein [Gaiellaceae bacterium]